MSQNNPEVPWSWTWTQTDQSRALDAELVSLLTAITRSMPNIHDLKISTWDCPFEAPEEQFCECFTTNHDLLTSLSNLPLQSIHVSLGLRQYDIKDCSDRFIASLLEDAHAKLQTVICSWNSRGRTDEDPYSNFQYHVRKTINVLTSLPSLTDLTLYDACSFTQLHGLEWKCPLRRLDISMSEDCKDIDIGLCLKNLPCSLEDLEIGFIELDDIEYGFTSASVPFPSHLNRLQNFRLFLPSSFALSSLLCFYPCRARKIFIEHTDYNTDNWFALVRAVEAGEAFPQVEEFMIVLDSSCVYIMEDPFENRLVESVKLQLEVGVGGRKVVSKRIIYRNPWLC